MTKPTRTAGVLDSSFPSLLLMGTLLAVALGLLAVCGWNIFALDSEREEIARERLLLERDRDAFLTYGGELPQMTERHRILSQEVARLEDRKAFLEKKTAELEKKTEESGAKASRLTGAISELQAQTQTLEAELGRQRAEMAKLQPEKAELQKEIAQLKAHDDGLATSIGQRQKQEAALLASLEGLARQKEHARTMLAKIADDREIFGKFETKLERLTARFDDILAKSDNLASEYSVKLAELEKSLAKLDNGMTVFNADRQALAANLDALKKDHNAYAAFLKQNGDQNRDLRAQVDLLIANNKKFSAAMDAVANLDAKLRNVIAAENAALKKMAEDDARNRANLSSSSQTLAQNAQTLKNQVEQSRESLDRVGDLLAKQREQLDGMAAMTARLNTAVERNSQTAQSEIETGAKLGQAAQALATQAEIFKSRLDLSEAQGRQIDKLMDNQSGRLKDLAGLAKQLGDEIAENRRRGARLEAMLGEIRDLVEKPARNVKTSETQPEIEPPLPATPQETSAGEAQ